MAFLVTDMISWIFHVTLKPKQAQRAANETDPIFMEKPVPGALSAADIGVRRIVKQEIFICKRN